MNKRFFLLAIIAVGLCFLNQVILAADQPNVILIMADDVGIEAFKTYGGESYSTPNIDRMAATGMQFQHCYSQPLCTPSRVKLMTGQSNVTNYFDFSLLHPDLTTIGHYMKRAGYTTGITGKWQLYGASHYKTTAGLGMRPENAGFDQYRLWQIEQLGSRYHDPLIIENGKKLEGKGKYGPKLFNDFALDFIRKHKDEPFFLYYPMVLVHDPFVQTPDSEKGGKLDQEQQRHAYFADMMAYMDKAVGKIIKEVEAQGLSDNTLIIFTGDNGTHQSITSQWKGAPTQGGKGLSTDAGTHVPLYAIWPGTIKPGTRTDCLVDFSDFLPTALEVAGTSALPEAQLSGKSFLPILKGDESKARDFVYTYSNPRPTRKAFRRAVFSRNQSYKLYADGRFYHVAKDRLEKNNITSGSEADQPKLRAELQAVIDSWPKHGEMLIEGSVVE